MRSAVRSAILWGAVALVAAVFPRVAAAQTNLALNRPVTASANPQFPPSEAVDGNTATRWASAQGLDPQWIYVDLGAATAINRVVLRWEAAYAKAYQIQTSNDAATWTSIYSTTAGPGGTETLTVSGNGRYVRMNGTARGSIYGYSLWEFEIYGGAAATPTATTRPRATATATTAARATATATTTSTTNLALNRPVTASANPQFAASMAVDGNLGTRWASAGGLDPQWIYVDLGAPMAIGRVILRWEAAYAKAYQIQTSNDAATWSSIYSTTTGIGGTETLTVAGNGRYVRMNGTARGTSFGYSLWEFEIYSSSGGPTPTATTRPAATATATTAARATATATTAVRATATATTGGTCSGNTNIALNKPAYTWYYQDSAREPKYAVNGDRTGGANDNRWATPWMPTAWIYIDLGAVATVNSIQLYWEAAYAIDYDILTSNDAVTWTVVRSVRGNAATTNTLTFSPAVKGRYVRLNGITRATTFGYSLYEFEIYGCGDNPTVTPTPPPAPLAGTYTLNWSDEFNGTALDTTKWQYDPGTPQNNEAENYTSGDTKNVRVTGGNLVLEAHKTTESGQACSGCPFTSGRINTLNKKTFKFGRMAASMKLPAYPGMWPAFWLLGVDLGTVGWPNCGELDIMENIGYTNWFSGSLHGPGYFGAGSVGGITTMAAPWTAMAYHEYRVDWDPTYVQWYLDGSLILTANRSDVVATRGQWVFDHDFYMIFNLAMGGDYPAGYNGVSTPYAGLPQSTIDRLPLQLDVDYVRVYQKQ
jgi:hypothetical protein